MAKTITFPDDYVIVFKYNNGPGSSILNVSSAEWAFNIIRSHPASDDHLWTITRLGRTFDRQSIYKAALTEGMASEGDIPPFDYQRALRAREERAHRELP